MEYAYWDNYIFGMTDMKLIILRLWNILIEPMT